MKMSRAVEYVFFFVLLVGSALLVWAVFSPFVAAFALALIVVTVCYPMYSWLEGKVWRSKRSLAALLATSLVVILVIAPLVFLTTVFIKEFSGLYESLNSGQTLMVDRYLVKVENWIASYVPEFELSITTYVKEFSGWLIKNMGTIFAGTVSTLFLLFITLLTIYYGFKDGQTLIKFLLKVSPLKDKDDLRIISRLAVAIRSVATGVLLVSILQGLSVGIGFAVFDIPQALLWGAVTALISLIPGIGTIVIMIPAIAYLALAGSTLSALGLAVWGLVAVILIDNIIGPYLMSRGNNLHPLLMLTSVLGGLSLFGPIGFILGPVVVTLFIVLLEIYSQYMVKSKKVKP